MVMRILFTVVLIFSVQTAFAIPRATPDLCATWVKKIAEYSDKLHQADLPEQRAFYRGKIDEYQNRRQTARCLAR